MASNSETKIMINKKSIEKVGFLFLQAACGGNIKTFLKQIQKAGKNPETKEVMRKVETLYKESEDGDFLSVVKFLITNDFPVNAKSIGQTPLHFAVRMGDIEVVKLLVENEAKIDAKDTNGYASLHIAAQNGHLEIIKHLIENGAQIEERGKYGYTPLHIAAQNGYLLIFKYLNEKGAKIDVKDQYGQTVVHHAVVNDHIHILKYLKEKKV